jgi:hypothetical protein
MDCKFFLRLFLNFFLNFCFSFRMQSVQNLGLACISILTGVIVDEAGYFILESNNFII